MIEIPRLKEPFDVAWPNSIKTLTYFSWHEILIQQRRIKWEFLIAKIMIQLRENILMSDSQDFKTLRILTRRISYSQDVVRFLQTLKIVTLQMLRCAPHVMMLSDFFRHKRSSHYKCSDLRPNATIPRETHSSTNFPWKTVRSKDTKFCDSAQVVDFMMTTLTKLASQFLSWFL
jgi:hypothetical protein